MKIAFNNLALKTGHQARGVGVYTKQLLQALRQKKGMEIYEFADISKVREVDLVHHPFFDFFQRTLPLTCNFPRVVTIHDVIPLIFPRYYPPGPCGFLNNFWQKWALRNVQAIITDSESSKKDIASYLGVDPEKIFSVYLAAAHHFKPLKNQNFLEKVKEQYHLPKVFALYVGDVNWNKNLVNMAKACKKIGMELVMVGKSFEQRENLDHTELRSFQEFLKEFGSDFAIHILGFVADEDLVAFYNLATVTLLPSFYEGFGLPILESQACGTPVVTSRISSMPEVAGNGALFVDPYNIESISQAIKEIIQDKLVRNNLIKMGFDNMTRFSWKKTADKTIDVYSKVIHQK